MTTVMQRCLTGMVLIVLVVLCLFYVPPSWAFIASVALMLWCACEWYTISGVNHIRGLSYAYALMVLGVMLWAYGSPHAMLLAYGALFVYVTSMLFFRSFDAKTKHTALRQKMRHGLGLVLGMVILPATWLAMMALYRQTPWLLLMVLSLVWVADSGAYFIGRRFGRHALMPNVSPKKTWEGALGAMALVMGLTALWFQASWLSLHRLDFGLLLAVLTTMLSIVGDLFESAMKRLSAVKDSGALLPGHGGILDRLDGVFAALPFWWVVMHHLLGP